MTTAEVMYCRRCRLALHIHRRVDGTATTFLHAAQARGEVTDHAPEPVPLTDLGATARMVCDLCSTPDPSYVYAFGDQQTDVDRITRTFVSHHDYRDRNRAARVRRVETATVGTQVWGERWACCDGCAALIEAGDLLGLIRRVTDAMPAKYTRGKRLITVRGSLHATYSHLLATRRAGRGRITPDHPLGQWADNTNPEDTDHDDDQ